MDKTMRIPVEATMSRQPDGSYKMVQAEYADISADDFAKFLLKAFEAVNQS